MDNTLILLIVAAELDDEGLGDKKLDPGSMRHALSRAGMELEIMKVAQREAANPSGMMQGMTGRSYGCMVLDDSLPGAASLVEALRAAGSTTPVVVLSGQDNDDEALLDAGVADQLRKDTLDGTQLALRLANTVRAHRAEERARQAMDQFAAERGLLDGVLDALDRIGGVLTTQHDEATQDEATLVDALSREAARMGDTGFGVSYGNEAGEKAGSYTARSSQDAFNARHERAAQAIACVASMATDNIQLRAQARQAARVRDELLSVVSHNLRNPLNTISIAAESMGDMRELDADQRLRYVGVIRRGVERASRLIGDLLDAGNIEAGKLSIAPARTAAHRLLDQGVRDHASQAEKRGVSLIMAAPADLPKVMADAGRIRQVLSHLLDNAIRCTPSGGRVELSADPGKDVICIRVSDTGIGIPEQDLPRVCERFYQVGEQHRTGPGLGLYIARGIVEAHHGHLTVESEPGRKTTVEFTLPQAT